ncbi:alpha/beta fold hydrolase [Pseudonocardia sp. NPDC049154]|uniref:alpha/beta fold hydrolase n=1 Tax=Pseudonocardia sp. NPDC049154 TaxID=3155501 RepID=UPI0033E5C808
MYVEWEAPEVVTRPFPLVLVHGGGGQGSEWLTTVDEKPGWAAHFVAAGFATYVVDRPGLGRSPYHPDLIGPMGSVFPYEAAVGLFAPPDRTAEQTQWPFGRGSGSPELDHLVAGFGPLPADLAASQQLDAARLVSLLHRIGPSVLVTHSAGGPAGWLVTDRTPANVVGVAAIEPMGPPFATFPIGSLEWGLTTAPITFARQFERADEVRDAQPADLRIPSFADKPMAVFTGSASPFRDWAPATVDFLSTAGAKATWVDLQKWGIAGNGHGLIFEKNAHETVQPIIEWITKLGS